MRECLKIVYQEENKRKFRDAFYFCILLFLGANMDHLGGELVRQSLGHLESAFC